MKQPGITVLYLVEFFKSDTNVPAGKNGASALHPGGENLAPLTMGKFC